VSEHWIAYLGYNSCDVESVLLLTRFFVIHINIHDIGLHQNYSVNGQKTRCITVLFFVPKMHQNKTHLRASVNQKFTHIGFKNGGRLTRLKQSVR